MSLKLQLRRALAALDEAKGKLKRAKNDVDDDGDIRRALNELEEAEAYIQRAIRELPN